MIDAAPAQTVCTVLVSEYESYVAVLLHEIQDMLLGLVIDVHVQDQLTLPDSGPQSLPEFSVDVDLERSVLADEFDKHLLDGFVDLTGRGIGQTAQMFTRLQTVKMDFCSSKTYFRIYGAKIVFVLMIKKQKKLVSYFVVN